MLKHKQAAQTDLTRAPMSKEKERAAIDSDDEVDEAGNLRCYGGL